MPTSQPSKSFLRKIYQNRLTEDKLDMLYTLVTELDLVCKTSVTEFDLKQFDSALKQTAGEKDFNPGALSQLQIMENLWKKRRKKYVPVDHDISNRVIKLNF